MAKETHASKNDMHVITSNDIFEVRSMDWGDYTVSFFKVKEDWNPSPLLFKGLQGDRCQTPHYGYVLKGKARMKYKDHEETFMHAFLNETLQLQSKRTRSPLPFNYREYILN